MTARSPNDRTPPSRSWRVSLTVSLTFAAVFALSPLTGCVRRTAAQDTRLSGDWDYYVTIGAAPNGGFEARRRMGVAHLEGSSADGAWLKRRSGAPLESISKVT